MANAIKFALYGTATVVYFDEDEYRRCVEIPGNESEEHVSASRPPLVFDRTSNGAGRKLELNIFEMSSTTRDKVVSLIRYDAEYWTMYPLFLGTPSYSINVLPDPIFLSHYSFGQKTEVVHKLTLYEVAA